MTDYGQKHPLSFWLLAAAIALGLLPTAALAAPPGGDTWPTAKSSSGAQQSAQQTRKKRKKRLKKKRRPRKQEKQQAEQSTQSTEAEAPKLEGADEAEVQAAATAGAGIDSGRQRGSVRRSNKMEFDARLIRGETAGSGAVILFDRGHRELPSLTKSRTRFLNQTLEEIYKPQSEARARPKPKKK